MIFHKKNYVFAREYLKKGLEILEIICYNNGAKQHIISNGENYGTHARYFVRRRERS